MGGVETRYWSGKSLKEIGSDLEVNRATLWKRLKRRGAELRNKGRRPKLSDEQKSEVAARYKNGETMAELAESFDVCITTIEKGLECLGVDRRKGRAHVGVKPRGP